MTLSGPAKRFCSAIWVSERVREEALYNSVLYTDKQVSDYEGGSLTIEVEEHRAIAPVARAAPNEIQPQPQRAAPRGRAAAPSTSHTAAENILVAPRLCNGSSEEACNRLPTVSNATKSVTL